MNIDLLIEEMDKKGKSKEALANDLKIDRATIYRKFAKKGEAFTIKEAQAVVNSLKLNAKEATKIFFEE